MSVYHVTSRCHDVHHYARQMLRSHRGGGDTCRGHVVPVGMIKKNRNKESIERPRSIINGRQETLGTSAESLEALKRIDSDEPIVALGKFNALHMGHKELAIQASKVGYPWMLSFSGMEKILGRPTRVPLNAAIDRERIISSWASECNGREPREYIIPFHLIRNLQPEEFVHLLVRKMGVAGVVCGENYRFGYKAAGDTKLLQSLGEKLNIPVQIVALRDQQVGSTSEPISSSLIRTLLSSSDMSLVGQMLGRNYRLIATLDKSGSKLGGELNVISLGDFFNEVPAQGTYKVQFAITNEEAYVKGLRPSLDNTGTLQIKESSAILEWCDTNVTLEDQDTHPGPQSIVLIEFL